MRLELIPYEPGIHGWLAEFYPGQQRWRHWSEDSIYVDGDVFEVLCVLVGYFRLDGPITISGGRLDQLIKELEGLAKRISKSESSEEIWPIPNDGKHNYWNPFAETGDWKETRRAFSLMLRELVVWIRGVKAHNQPLTVNGL